MIDTLTSTPFFGLGVTLLCWYLAVRFQKRTGLLICNPVLVASLLVIGDHAAVPHPSGQLQRRRQHYQTAAGSRPPPFWL